MKTKSERFLALDIFRGLTVCFMIIVNTSGDWATTFAPLQHALWDGFTPTDLVFPSFLFAVGNALSFVSLKWENLPQGQVVFKIFKRTFIIFLLGYLMYWFPFFKLDQLHNIIPFPISETRIFGVLQRIALCYGIAALMIYYLKPKTNVIASIAFLLIYWLILYMYGTYDMHHNPVTDIDLRLFGPDHLYHGEGFAFDPEGLLSTLPSVVNVLAGFFAGVYIQKKGKKYDGLSKLLMFGFLFIAVAFMWDYVFPVNKKMWTSSYSLLTIGIDLCILSLIIYYTEFKRMTKGSYFFEVFGKNPLTIYLLSEILAICLWMIPVGDESLYRWIFVNLFSPFGGYTGSFLFAIVYMLVCWSVGFLMDKKRIYIRI